MTTSSASATLCVTFSPYYILSVNNEVRDKTESINQKEEGIIFGEFKAPIALESKRLTLCVLSSISLLKMLSLHDFFKIFFYEDIRSILG